MATRPVPVTGAGLAWPVVVALAGFALAGTTDPDEAHFPSVSTVVALVYLALAVLLAGLVGVRVAWRGPRALPTTLRWAALASAVGGVVGVFAFGGLLVWVTPLLIIAAEIAERQAAGRATRNLSAGVVIAVVIALAYGLVDQGSGSALLGGGLLWLMAIAVAP